MTGTTRGRRPRRRSWIQRLILLTNIVLIAASLTAVALLQYGYDRASDIQRVELGRSLTPISEESEAGGRVLNILLVGSDSSAGLDASDPVQIGRQGERFGDVIIVAHIDERSGQLALLSFPRDLWVRIAGVNRSDRINRAFEVGGPAMLIDTIEQNFDLPIHHYVNVDFAGFQGLVEAVGSVDVHFEAPARDWNVNAQPEPRSQTGFLVSEAGCHALDPPTALAYVRSRYYQTQRPDGTWVTDPTSDFGRISRQQDFLKRLMYRAIDLGARNPFVLADMVDTGLENVAIDESLTPQLLVDLGAAYRSFDPGTLQTYSFPVVDSVIDGNQVLEPQLDQARPVLALMRGAAHDDPTTIDLSIVSSASESGRPSPYEPAAALATGMGEAGFEYRQRTRNDLTSGITVVHGPNGGAAARVVVDAIDDVRAKLEPAISELLPEPEVVQAEGLAGRSVQILVGPMGNSPESLAAPSAGAGSTTTSLAARGDQSGGSTPTIDRSVDPGGRMANQPTPSTLFTVIPDGQESGHQPVDSEETACRST